MKTFPDFTWDWIVESCENFCSHLQNSIDQTDNLSERRKGYIETAQGTIAIVQKLREHPQLEKLVPMKSLMSLRWFPSENCEVQLYCEENEVKYSITIIRRDNDDIREKKL
jgi:hypothetical protein